MDVPTYFCSMAAIEKMKVEIWSDVMCPFCYIGKRRFEDALGQFAHKDQIEIAIPAMIRRERRALAFGRSLPVDCHSVH